MNKNVKRAVFSALASVAVAAPLIGLTTTSASAINTVDCGRQDFTEVVGHNDYIGIAVPSSDCYANAGETPLDSSEWITSIQTGNNNVQYFADNQWQPATPIPPHTDFTFPNHLGGVQLQKIRIV